MYVAGLADIQRIVAAEAVDIDPAIRDDLPLDHRHQRGRSGIVHHLAGGTTTALSLADTTEAALVRFDSPVENLVFNQGQLAQVAAVERHHIGLDAQRTDSRTGSHFERKELGQTGFA